MLEKRFEIVTTKNGEPRFLHTQSYCLDDVQLNQDIVDLMMKHNEKTRGPMKKNIWGQTEEEEEKTGKKSHSFKFIVTE